MADIASQAIVKTAERTLASQITPDAIWNVVKESSVDSLFIGGCCIVAAMVISLGIEKIGLVLYRYIGRSIILMFMTMSITMSLFQSRVGGFMQEYISVSTVMITMSNVIFGNNTTTTSLPSESPEQPPPNIV